MANATKFPTIGELVYIKWQRPDTPNPKLAAPLSASLSDDTLTFTVALTDKDGNVPTAAVAINVVNEDSYAESMLIPAGGLSADGLTATGVIRGLDPSGTDYTTGDTSFVAEHQQDSPVACNIPAFLPSLLVAALQGSIASGGDSFIIGTDASGTVTVKRSTGVGTSVGFIRHNGTNAQYSNDGSTWYNFDDVTASSLAKVSSNDTTAGYLNGKLVAGDNVTFTEGNDGGDETLTIATSVGTGITAPSTYTPAYLTGGTNAESDAAVWDSVSDASFRITIDGTAYNIDGIDFTPQAGGDMDDMAGVIQAAIRAETSSTETCVWSTDHFVITSVDTTSSSEVTVTTTSTGTVGTDISGAGASDWMDCDSGNGSPTGAALNQSGDSGEIPLLGSNGRLNSLFLPDASSQLLVAGETIDGTTTPVAVYVSDGSNSRTAGRVYKADADDTTNMAIRFMGFVTSSVTAGDSVAVYIDGVVGGFSSLTQGIDYYLSSTAGAISNTVEVNPSIRVGRAISDTELMIVKDAPVVMSYASTSTGAVLENEYVDVTITCGFRPKWILANFTYAPTTDEAASWGMWVGGTEYNIKGVTDVSSNDTNFRSGGAYLGRIDEDVPSFGDYWQITLPSFTDNTVTLRYTAKGGGANNTIISNLIIHG